MGKTVMAEAKRAQGGVFSYKVGRRIAVASLQPYLTSLKPMAWKRPTLGTGPGVLLLTSLTKRE